MSTYFALRYDFRAAGVTRVQRQEMYGRALEQAPYAEQHGFGAVMLSEHHASDDGYLPSPIPAASAVAAVTSTLPISISALLANLYDPVRLAEDIAVLDHLSGGRVSYVFGLGYRPEEYAALAVPGAPGVSTSSSRSGRCWRCGPGRRPRSTAGACRSARCPSPTRTRCSSTAVAARPPPAAPPVSGSTSPRSTATPSCARSTAVPARSSVASRAS